MKRIPPVHIMITSFIAQPHLRNFFASGSLSVKKFLFLSGLMMLFSNLAFAQLVPRFTTNKSEGCSPLAVSFTNTSAGAVSYYWDFGNGNTSVTANPAATFITPGTYSVTLKAKSANGIELATSQTITVFANPVADLTADKTGGCVNDAISFTDRSVNGTNPITKWSWDFGDGSGSLLQNPLNHAYSFGDKFKVTLVVEDEFGCRSILVKNNYIDITDLKVNFSNSLASVCSGPLQVHFNDLTTPANPLYAYAWDFGDGHTSTRKNDSNTYLTKGSYPVALKVTAPNGCAATAVKSGRVLIHQPQAAFYAANPTGCQPLKAAFVNLSTAADPGAVVYSWSTSNGLTSTAKDPVFTFTDTGTYSITLKISIPGVCADSVTKTDYIHVVPKANVTITASGYQFCATPAQVAFTVAPLQSNVLAWIWGDNTMDGALASPSKTFTRFGDFAVKAVVENTAGCRDTIGVSAPIVVRPSGFKINLSKNKGCVPFTITMEAIDTGLVALDNWQWTLNGIPAGNTSAVLQSFSDTGIYVVSCTGSNSSGCVFTLTDTIKAGAITYPQYTIDKEISCASDATFTFHNQTNVTTPRADSWFWAFGDHFGALEEEPVHQYKDTGTFRIMLTAIHKGCSTSVEHRQVTVLGPKTAFDEPALNCYNDSLVFAAITKGGNTLLWDFGDGSFSSVKLAKHKYAMPGTYQVTLIARDSITGCSDTTTKPMNVPDMFVPVLSYTQSVAAACPGEPLVFEDLTAGDQLNTLWVLAGGLTSRAKSVTFTLQDTGYHMLQLIVTDAKGCTFQLKKDSAIRIYPGAAKFSLSDPIGCMPLAVKATDRSTTTFPIVSRNWKWGTGDSTANNSGETFYTYQGTPADQSAGYTVQLQVTDSMGCTYKTSGTVKPLKPFAGYTSQLVKGCGFDSVRFIPQPTSGGVAPFRFNWIAGTDTLSKEDHPALRFSFPDTAFEVRLVVTDSFQCSNSFSALIKTDARKPFAAFGVAPERILDCPGPPVFLMDSSVRGASGLRSWEWSFGDHTKSIIRHPSKTYLEPGNYDVTLTISDSLNCQSSVTKNSYIRVLGPVASYRITEKAGCLPLATSFEAHSTNTKRFEWDMGDGLVDTNALYSHIYSRSGKYVPSLSITDSAGCRRSLPLADTVQVYSLPEPAFTNNRSLICAGSDVLFKNESVHDKVVKRYAWSFGDGDSLVETTHQPVSHTYRTTGKFDVQLRITDSLGCSQTAILKKIVTVTNDKTAPEVPQVLRSTVVDHENVLLQFRQNNDSDFAKYTLYYNYDLSGNALNSDSVIDVADTSFIQTGINTSRNRYFYSVSATDVCSNESQRSPLHGTMELTAWPAANSVSVQWSAYKGWNAASYEIYRSNDGLGEYQPLAKVNGTTTVFTDSTVKCHRTYFYKIRAREEGGNGQESWSDSSGASPIFISTIPGTRNIRATVTDDARVLLEWRKQVHTLSFVPVLYRSVNNEEPVYYKELNTQDTFFIDDDVDVQHNSYTYITYLKDNCGALSVPSNRAKTILLSVELQQTERKDYNPELTWTSYIDWETGVDKYVVEFKFDSLARFAPKTATAEPGFFDRDIDEKQRQYCYRITAYQKGDAKVYSRSNPVCVSTDPQLYAPNAFSPNGDGLNETFKIGGIFLEAFNLRIWNRYGELLYESSNMLDGWDGTYQGKAVPTDAYTYLAEGKGKTGKLVEVKGSVTVLW